MYTVLIVIHFMVTLALIGIILVQRNSGDMGLSGSSSTSFMSGRAAATFITRTTAILAAVFILLSLGIGIVTAREHSNTRSIMENVKTEPSQPAIPETKTAPAAEKPASPSIPRPE